MLDNQTVAERNKQIRIYDLGSKLRNIEESLGANWFLTFLSPFLPSKMLSDGIHYPLGPNYHVKPDPKQQQHTNKTK